MFGLVFSYAKSIITLIIMTTLTVLFGALGCIYIKNALLLTTLLLCLCALLIVSFLAAYAIAAKELARQETLLCNSQCLFSKLSSRINTLIKRCHGKQIRASLYAILFRALYYNGKYDEAEKAVSRALELTPIDISGIIHQQLAFISFVNNDVEKFNQMYPIAKANITKYYQYMGKNNTRALDNTLIELDIMNDIISNNFSVAESKITLALERDNDKLLNLALRALRLEISARAKTEPDQQYKDYLSANAGEFHFCAII